MRGTIKSYNSDKGYGFVRADDSPSDVFFHITKVLRGEPTPGATVEFDLGERRDGRPMAVDVVVHGDESAFVKLFFDE